MPNQLAISFDLHKPEFTCLARKTDPITSHEAGLAIEESGDAEAQRGSILEALGHLGPSTSKQMQWRTNMTNTQISRRSGELVGEGKPCKYLHGEKVNKCQVWALNSQCYRNADGNYVRLPDCKIARVGECV